MKNQSVHKEFIHPVLNAEVQTISGQYIYSAERRLEFNDQQVLYFIGCAIVDSSCCGAGGCVFALVPGYIRDWKYKKSNDNLSVSRVEPIQDANARSEIRRLILKIDPVQQVNFE